MLHSKEEAVTFVKMFHNTYLIERNIEKIFLMLSDKIFWTGIQSNKTAVHFNAVKALLMKEQKKESDILEIIESKYHAEEISEGIYLVNSGLVLKNKHNETIITAFPVTSSVICKKEGESYQLLQVHYSLAVTDKNFIAFINNFFNQGENHVLKKIIEEKTSILEKVNNDLQTLTDNVPGGIFRCRFDDSLTILQMSDGFLSMIGYSRTEVRDILHNSFKNIIDPRDRESSYVEVTEQLAHSNTKKIEYRILHKDGHSIWVLDKGQLLVNKNGEKSFYCIIVDITQEKKAQEELRLGLERYKIIMDQTNDIIFEWDIQSDYLMLSSNWEKKFGFSADSKRLYKLIYSNWQTPFHPEDRKIIQKKMEAILSGAEYLETEVRIKKKDGIYIWCRIRVTTQFDSLKTPIKAIGVIIDIDQDKRETETLHQKAEQDALTGLYNKITSQSMIQEYLLHCAAGQVCMLLIIDIDNFKTVNDTMGHLFGDSVLTEVAREIKKGFRRNDIVGRVGGDEFIVFIKDMDNMDDILERVNNMLKTIPCLLQNNKKQCYISLSIGISMAPKDGNTLPELYKKADYALYQAKKEGKGRYILYDETKIGKFIHQKDKQFSVINERIDSNEDSKVTGGRLVEYVFSILYNSKDIKAAVQTMLEIVGTQFDVSRVYIFENTEDNEYCQNTFEWCNTNVPPQIHLLQQISYKDLGENYMDNFNESGIFYCRDIRDLCKEQYSILKMQGIKSVLQCAIVSNGIFKGYVGFDECRQNRYWTQEQIDVLVFISEVLSTFLLKDRAEEKLRQESLGLLAVLNNQNSWIYVIEPETYKLLYINEKTNKIAPYAKIGMRCHEVFLNRKVPCENCPAKMVHKGCKNKTVEFYNPVLDVWSDADASYITWKGKDAILLSCHDITKYKK